MARIDLERSDPGSFKQKLSSIFSLKEPRLEHSRSILAMTNVHEGGMTGSFHAILGPSWRGVPFRFVHVLALLVPLVLGIPSSDIVSHVKGDVYNF